LKGKLVLVAIFAVWALAAVAPAAPKPPMGSRANPYPLGGPVRLRAPLLQGWVIKVAKSWPSAWPLIRAVNQFNDPPRAGMTFFMVRLVATYEGSGSDSFFDGALNAVGRSNVSYSTFDPGCGALPNTLTTNDVFKGGTISGNICWSVKKSDVSSLEMYFDAFLSRKVFFALR
jgi:hypothetical protein